LAAFSAAAVFDSTVFVRIDIDHFRSFASRVRIRDPERRVAGHSGKNVVSSSEPDLI
jgi:hypothetical protein